MEKERAYRCAFRRDKKAENRGKWEERRGGAKQGAVHSGRSLIRASRRGFQRCDSSEERPRRERPERPSHPIKAPQKATLIGAATSNQKRPCPETPEPSWKSPKSSGFPRMKQRGGAMKPGRHPPVTMITPNTHSHHSHLLLWQPRFLEFIPLRLRRLCDCKIQKIKRQRVCGRLEAQLLKQLNSRFGKRR